MLIPEPAWSKSHSQMHTHWRCVCGFSHSSLIMDTYTPYEAFFNYPALSFFLPAVINELL